MNPKPFPSLTNPGQVRGTLTPAVKVCVLCNPGKQLENWVCPSCESMLASKPKKLDLRMIHEEVWEDRAECDGCYFKNKYRDGTVSCRAKPNDCPAVKDAIDVMAATISVPDVMADFLVDCSDQLSLAAILISACGNTEFKEALSPLIANWVQHQSIHKRKAYAQETYGAEVQPLAPAANSEIPPAVRAAG